MNESQKVTTYSAQASNRHIIHHLKDIVSELPKSHELGLRLFTRNLRALYRQSLFGFWWALLPPIATAALWIFLRGSNVVNMQDAGTSYPVFVFTGTMLWQIFSEAISTPINQVSQNKAMLAKINIPREGLLLSGAYELFFNILIKLVLLLSIYLYFQQQISPFGFLFAFIGIFAISVAGFSIGLALTPLGMLYQDINRGLAILLPFFMYLTPVVYPIPQGGILGQIMKFNPLSTLIVQTRNGITSQPMYDLPLFWMLTVFFTLFFLVCLVGYRLAMPMIIERMGS